MRVVTVRQRAALCGSSPDMAVGGDRSAPCKQAQQDGRAHCRRVRVGKKQIMRGEKTAEHA